MAIEKTSKEKQERKDEVKDYGRDLDDRTSELANSGSEQQASEFLQQDNDKVLQMQDGSLTFKRRISTNLLIKDKFTSVSAKEKDFISQLFFSTRRIDSCLDARPVIRCGIATLSFYQLFDSVLSRKIANDYKNIAVLLQNTPLIKSVILKVLANIPKRDGLRNNGYLKSHMSLQRGFIQEDLENILKGAFNVSDEDRGDNTQEGLAIILQTILTHEFAKHHLLDYSELAISNMCVVDEYNFDYANMYQFRDYVLSEYVHKAIIKISRLSDNISNLITSAETDDKTGRGVDFAVIIEGCMKIVNEVADYLSLLDQRRNVFYFLLCGLRLFRDRQVFQRIPLYNEIMTAVEELYASNTRFFDMCLGNYEFNKWMDEIPVETLEAVRNSFLSAIVGAKHMLLDVMTQIDSVIHSEFSLVRILSKEEYLSFFNIAVKKDFLLDRAKHLFISRKLGQLNTPDLFEIFAQTERPYRRMSKSLSADTFMLINGKFYSKIEYESLIEDIGKIITESAESSFLSVCDAFLPDVTDGLICQTVHLNKGDLNKLASMMADEVKVYYEAIAPSLFTNPNLFTFNDGKVIDLLTDGKYAGGDVQEQSLNFINNFLNKNKLDYYKCPIFVKKLKRLDSSHGDIYRPLNDVSERYIVTREARLVCADNDGTIGKNHNLINSNMISHPKAFASKKFMVDDFQQRMSLIDTNSTYEVNIPSAFSGVASDLRVKINTNKLWNPVSPLTIMCTPTSPYRSLLDDYCKAVDLFKAHCFQYSRTIDAEAILNDDKSDVLKELPESIKDEYLNLANFFGKNNLVKESEWLIGLFSTSEAYNRVINNMNVFESGEWVDLAFREQGTNYSNGYPTSATLRVAAQSRINAVSNSRSFNYACTFQARVYNQLARLLETSSLFKAIVHSVELCKDGSSSERFEDYIALLKMFESRNGASVGRLLELSVASLVACFLYIPTLYGGDSRKAFGKYKESRGAEALLTYAADYSSKLIVQFNSYSYHKFNKSMLNDDLKLIENLNNDNIFSYYHVAHSDKAYEFNAFEIMQSDTQVKDNSKLGKY